MTLERKKPRETTVSIDGKVTAVPPSTNTAALDIPQNLKQVCTAS